MRGRPPSGPSYVQQLPGSEQARQRAEVILQTLAGTTPVQQACALLGVGETRFHQLRQEMLTAAIEALEARPSGRPAQVVPPAAAPLQQLQEQLSQLQVDLRVAQVREEIALVLPQRPVSSLRATPAVLAPSQEPAEATPEKKTRRRRGSGRPGMTGTTRSRRRT